FPGCMFTEWTTGLLDAARMGPTEFELARRMIDHTGVPLHDLEGFRRWGTVQTIGSLLAESAGVFAVHYGLLYALGGASWCLAAGSALLIAHYFNLEFNYTAHGSGRAQHRDGWDFHRADLSLNQRAPGFLGGEWHNNHHMFPCSMRSGFLPGQLDVPFQ